MGTFTNTRFMFLTWLRVGIRDNPESRDSSVGCQATVPGDAHSQESEYLAKDGVCSGSPVMTLLPQPLHEDICRYFH